MAIVHRQPFGGANVLVVLDADPQAGAGTAADTGTLGFLPGVGIFSKIGAGDTNWGRLSIYDEIADPGNAGAIPVVHAGFCALTSAGAETRTLAIPTFRGQQLDLFCTVYVGNIVTTVASAIDTAGNTTITMGNVGDSIRLVATDRGGTLFWCVVGNNGCALT